jgi:hypothetical protein
MDPPTFQVHLFMLPNLIFFLCSSFPTKTQEAILTYIPIKWLPCD